MSCIRKIQIGDTIYEANTDFRIAIECNRIATDDTIDDYERVLGIICTVFGKDSIDIPEHYEKLLKWIKNWLSRGEEIKNDKPDMDYIQDYNLIWASMYGDYHGLDIDKEEIDWWKFLDLLNGLSNSEFGNCCVLNKIRNLRNIDVTKIKDNKERNEIIKAQKQFELKKNKKENNITREQEKSMQELNKILGI